jgi:hypothetical protein
MTDDEERALRDELTPNGIVFGFAPRRKYSDAPGTCEPCEHPQHPLGTCKFCTCRH